MIDAGKYDGVLGIIAALAALETLQQEKITLPFPVQLLAFSDEEGTRFQTTYLCSRSIIAPLDPATLEAKDAAGITIARGITNKGWNADATTIRYAPGECRGYVELHIEQGRVLEEENQSACVVSSIAGQSRLTVTPSSAAPITPAPRPCRCAATL